MSVFINTGNDWTVVNAPKEATRETLPVGNYTISYANNRGFYLSRVDDFSLPEKTYGKEAKRSQRVINTFLERPASTGIVLAGEKGSGKTLLAKKISIELAEMGMPTILVNEDYTDKADDFIKFVQSIEQPAAMIFDEFEKIHTVDHQKKLLTLFDGTTPTRKLFIVTVNDTYRMDDFLLNRPGRFYYLFNYGGLSDEAIEEFCQDKLNDKAEIKHIKNFSKMFNAFTFDMLSALVEEMNRYGETLDEVLQYMNVNYSDSSGAIYEIVHLEVPGKKIVKYGDVNYNNRFNPIKTKFHIIYDSENESDEYLYFDPKYITNIDESGTVTFKDTNTGTTLIIRRKVVSMFDYKDLSKAF